MASPIAEELSFPVVDVDAVEPLVGDVNVDVAVDGDGDGPDKLPRLFAIGTELGDLFLALIAHAENVDSGAVGTRLI